MSTQSKDIRLRLLLSDNGFHSDIPTLPLSESYVTWGENSVMVVLRHPDEIRRAELLGLRPVGTTLMIMRNDRGIPVRTDETIQRAIQFIKGALGEQ